MSKYKGLTRAQYVANVRYVGKTYKKVMFYLRVDDDSDILDALDEAKQHGITKRKWLRDLFEIGKS